MTLTDLIKNHWTVSHQHRRTPDQDEAEKYLFTLNYNGNYWATACMSFNRWFIFPAAFVIQFSVGSLYAWSVLNKPLDTLLYNNPSAEMAVNAFYIAVGCFGTSSALLGPWAERKGPRIAMVAGTTIFLAGMIISWLALEFKSIEGLYLGYGVFVGAGSGLCYIAPVSALQKWFPDYRGTAAGFAVTGFGAGSVVWGKTYLPTIELVGLPRLFLVIGCGLATLMYMCAIVLRLPPARFSAGGLNVHGERIQVSRGRRVPEPSPRAAFQTLATGKTRDDGVAPIDFNCPGAAAAAIKNLSLIDAIINPDFFFMYMMFFANQLFGLVVISKFSGMCQDLFGKTAAVGSTVVAINGIFNCAGRLVLPMASDVLIRQFNMEPALARRVIFFLTLGMQAVIVATLPAVIRAKNFYLFLAELWTLTMLYGGGFGTIPCFLTDMFGAYNVGAMHGLILTSWSIGGVGGGISFNAAYVNMVGHDAKMPKMPLAEAYIAIFYYLLLVIIFGFVMLMFVRTNHRDRFAPGYQYSVGGKRVVHITTSKNSDDDDEPVLMESRV